MNFRREVLNDEDSKSGFISCFSSVQCLGADCAIYLEAILCEKSATIQPNG
jgi:hypothetical protein